MKVFENGRQPLGIGVDHSIDFFDQRARYLTGSSQGWRFRLPHCWPCKGQQYPP
jgi:hypothetical protein